MDDSLATSLPLLEHARELHAGDWLRAAMTTFARSVASFLPGHFESYARIYHPFVRGLGTVAQKTFTWREVAGPGADLNDPRLLEWLSTFEPEDTTVRDGSLPAQLFGPLIEHLAPATTTPNRCWFAIWEGFAASVVPGYLEPKLELPGRRYHPFSGPVEAAHTDFSESPSRNQSANLWWPDDQAWCVATEVDLHWTYVGGARACIQSLLADSRMETIETTALALR